MTSRREISGGPDADGDGCGVRVDAAADGGLVDGVPLGICPVVGVVVAVVFEWPPTGCPVSTKTVRTAVGAVVGGADGDGLATGSAVLSDDVALGRYWPV